MEKNQYKLCIEVLRRLEKAGVLNSMVLIGSWCMPFYKDYFSGTDYHPSLKTRDIDLLIPRPETFKGTADVYELVKDLGFVKDFRGEGYLILEHPELAIEFLVPEKGRGTDKPVKLPRLGINAQALRFLEILSKNTITIRIEGISLALPHPANFALHKLILASRRQQKSKSNKDREAALNIMRALLAGGKQQVIKECFNSLSPRWRRPIMKALEENGDKNLVGLFVH